MSMVSYRKTSPYYGTPQQDWYLGFYSPRKITSEADDVLIELSAKYRHRPDKLSFDLYNTSSLWWVFSVRNPDVIKDPIYDMEPGIQIYLPSMATIGRLK